MIYSTARIPISEERRSSRSKRRNNDSEYLNGTLIRRDWQSDELDQLFFSLLRASFKIRAPCIFNIAIIRKYFNWNFFTTSTHHPRVSQFIFSRFSVLFRVQHSTLFSPRNFDSRGVHAIRGCMHTFSLFQCARWNAFLFPSSIAVRIFQKNRSDRARSITRLFKWRHSRDISSAELAALKSRWEWALSCLLDAEKISNSRENAFFPFFLFFPFSLCSLALARYH